MTEGSEIDQLLDELRATIADTPTLGDADRERIERLVDRIDEADDSDQDESLLDHFHDVVAQFETEHAGLVAVVNRIANHLSAGGI